VLVWGERVTRPAGTFATSHVSRDNRLVEQLSEIPGVVIGEESLTKRPRIPLALLAENQEALDALKRALEWFCDTVLAG
jgi:hypothetical protein